MSPYAVRLSTEVPSDAAVRPSDVSPDHFLARLAELERENPVEKERQRQLAKYDGPFGDGFFLFDILSGLSLVGLELPEDKHSAFVSGEITRDELLGFVRRVQGDS